MTVYNIDITVSVVMYFAALVPYIEKLVPTLTQFRLNLDQTLSTMFFLLPFLLGGFCITEQSALRLLCLFGVNE